MNVNDRTSTLSASLWFLFGGRELVRGKAMALLRAVDSMGSLSNAAKAVPMSYKSAWDLINNLNNSAPRPVVTTETGGRRGGGSCLSEYGKTILGLYSTLERNYESLMRKRQVKDTGNEALFSFISGVCMKTSARNQLAGTVVRVLRGKVNTEVHISLGEKLCVVSTITNDSAENMQLQSGVPVVALVKASSVLLFPGKENVRSSAENMLKGTVAAIRNGAVNSEVTVSLPGEKTITSIVTRNSVNNIGLRKGAKAVAAFSASQVVLALPV